MKECNFNLIQYINWNPRMRFPGNAVHASSYSLISAHLITNQLVPYDFISSAWKVQYYCTGSNTNKALHLFKDIDKQDVYIHLLENFIHLVTEHILNMYMYYTVSRTDLPVYLR